MKRIVAGAVLILTSFVVLGFGVVQFIEHLQHSGKQLSVPGSHEITIDTPGFYTLFHVYSGMHEGQIIGVPPGLPNGTTIQLLDDSEQVIAPTTSSSNIHMQSNNTAKQSVQTWDLTAGQYVLSIENLDVPYVVTLERFELFKFMKRFFAVLGLVMTLFLGGIGLIVFGIIGVKKKKKVAGGTRGRGEGENNAI